MAITEYKCDVCKRTKLIPRNIYGLERVLKCTITHGCRGGLYQIKLLQDFTRGSIPDSVYGLDNWVQRKIIHKHTQSISRPDWLIVHDMGIAPSLNVFVKTPIQGDEDHIEEIIPDDIEIVDNNTIILKFSRPYAGVAELLGNQSSTDILSKVDSDAVVTTNNFQISNHGEITVATRIYSIPETSNVNLKTIYTSAANATTTVDYLVDTNPSILSPWGDYDKITINGKLYNVRSFSAVTTEMTNGKVNNGSTFEFTKMTVDGETEREIDNKEILILLSSAPYANVDKLKDQFIDVTHDVAFGLFYDSGEFYALPSTAQKTYPLIRLV